MRRRSLKRRRADEANLDFHPAYVGDPRNAVNVAEFPRFDARGKLAQLLRHLSRQYEWEGKHLGFHAEIVGHGR